MTRKNSRYARALLLGGLIASGGCGDSASQLAKIGDTQITKQEYESYLALKRVPKSDTRRRAEMLTPYLDRAAIAQAIQAQKNLDTQQIQTEIEEFKKELLISRYFEKFLETKVNDNAVRNYYSSHETEFKTRRVHAAHILIRAPRDLGETERQAKLTRAAEVVSKLRAGGDFRALAEEYSEDRISARKGGDLGWLKEGSIDPKFSAALFKVKAGEWVEPIQSAFGYHVVQVLEGPSDVAEAFESVANDIRYRLRVQAKEAEMKRLATVTGIVRGPAANSFRVPAAPTQNAKATASNQ